MKTGLILAYAIAIVALLMVSMPAYADTGKPSVAVTGVTAAPGVFMPGDTGTITVTIANPSASLTGSSTTQTDTYNYGAGSSNGLTTPSHTSTTQTSSSNTPDDGIDITGVTLTADAPIQVLSQQFNDIGRLGMGDSVKLTFNIKVDDNAADTTYYATLQIRTDDGGIYMNYPIAIQVDNKPVDIYVDSAPQSFSSTGQSVTLDVVNNRPDDITGVGVIPSGSGFGFTPQQQYVIGTINSGDSYTAQFSVIALNGTYTGDPQFKVVYQNGNNLHETAPVAIATNHNAQQPKSSGDGRLPLIIGGIVILAIVLVGAIIYVRGWRLKK